MKRESGVNPERYSHCVRESSAIPLGNREGQTCDDRSQETCLGVEFQIRCLRVDLPASLTAPGLFALRATDDTVRENGCGNAAVFIFLSEHF